MSANDLIFIVIALAGLATWLALTEASNAWASLR